MRFFLSNLHQKKCQICSKESPEISEKLGVCKECILTQNQEAMEIINKTRVKYRMKYNLTIAPPKTRKGLTCGDCVNYCRFGEGEIGFCNLVKNVNQKLVRLAGDEKNGLFSFYYDPLPTNCVASPFCPGGRMV